MILRYKDTQSSRHSMPGGSPQGALLGVLLYLVYVSDIGMNLPSLPPQISGVTDLPSVSFPPDPAVSEDEARLKFVDDLSLAEKITLDSQLETLGDSLILNSSKSLLQSRLNELSLSAKYHSMKLNLKKTKIITFNFTRKHSFIPNLLLEGTQLDVVQNTKLLGLTVTNDGRFDMNTKIMVSKGNSRLWFLRRLKLLGASKDTLITMYKLFCRSILEYCAPVWAGSLSKSSIQNIERVQKSAFKIILGAKYKSYEDSLKEVNEDTLQTRRDTLTLRFARSCLKNSKFSQWFKPKEGMQTRSCLLFCEPQSKTKRYRNSAIPYMTRLLNSNQN